MVSKLGDDAGAVDFLPFSDNEASVREDVEKIRNTSLLPDGITVSGYIYDVNTGALQTVVGAGSQAAVERSAMAASTSASSGMGGAPGGPAGPKP